jgi:hypothetical protein
MTLVCSPMVRKEPEFAPRRFATSTSEAQGDPGRGGEEPVNAEYTLRGNAGTCESQGRTEAGVVPC